VRAEVREDQTVVLMVHLSQQVVEEGRAGGEEKRVDRNKTSISAPHSYQSKIKLYMHTFYDGQRYK
jgi:hypothetical protein